MHSDARSQPFRAEGAIFPSDQLPEILVMSSLDCEPEQCNNYLEANNLGVLPSNFFVDER